MSMDDETDSRYTTGDIAKLTGVSVRTVQYYDAKGLLTVSYTHLTLPTICSV